MILHGLGMFVADMFKSRRRLEAENLRHQLNIALRRAPPRPRLYSSDRALLVWITGIWPNLVDLSQVVKPETILTKMRRYRERSRDTGPLSPRPFCPGCIISTCGYDFRKGQLWRASFISAKRVRDPRRARMARPAAVWL